MCVKMFFFFLEKVSIKRVMSTTSKLSWRPKCISGNCQKRNLRQQILDVTPCRLTQNTPTSPHPHALWFLNFPRTTKYLNMSTFSNKFELSCGLKKKRWKRTCTVSCNNQPLAEHFPKCLHVSTVGERLYDLNQWRPEWTEVYVQ